MFLKILKIHLNLMSLNYRMFRMNHLFLLSHLFQNFLMNHLFRMNH